ncbi:MAG: hypothetical protein SV765_11870 [Pseudomonadota bacterium]|nr:hypothetical protein [Pseudomonadota bacterium]
MNKYLLSMVVCLVIAPGVAIANTKDLQNALAKAQYMLRQATQEKQELSGKVAQLEQEIKQLKEQTARKIAAEESASDKLSNKLDMYQQKFTELRANYVELLDSYRQEQAKSTELSDKLAQASQEFQQCKTDNLALYGVNQELLGKYEDKGFWDLLAKNEPFTGIKQVEIENLIQTYQFKNEDLLVKDSTQETPSANN